MNAKMDQFPSINPNPVLSVAKNGTVLYSNNASEPLLHVWGVGVEDKLPLSIRDLVQKIIFSNSSEKLEVKIGKIVYMLAFHPVPEEECVNIYGFDISEQKELEEKLRVSEKRERARSDELAAVLDAVPVAVFISRDPQVLKITGNRLAYEWVQLPVGVNFSKSAPEGERPETFKLFKNGIEMLPEEMPSQLAAAGIDVNDCELDIVSANGDIRHLLGNARPLRDEQGNIRGSISAFIDITERKKAEEALKKTHDSLEEKVKERTDELEQAYALLKESEERLAEAQKIAHIGSWECNPFTKSLFWTEEAYSIFGLDPQIELTDDVFLNFVHPEDREYINHAINEAYNGKQYDLDYRIILTNGQERVVHVQGKAIFDEKNTPIRMRGIVQDITERKQAEEALRESEERFNLAVKAAQEGVWDWNMETDEVWYSSRYKEMLGYSEDEIEHHVSAWLRLLHPDDKERTLQLVDAVMRGERNYEVEFRLRHKDGHYLNILSRGYPVRRESDGKIVRIVGVHLDLTERKLAEQALLDSEKSLSEAQRMAHIGNWVWDVTTDKAYWSDELYHIFKRIPHELAPSYDEYLDYVHPDDREEADNAHKQALNGKPFSMDHRITLANGEIHTIHIQTEVIFNDENVPIRLKGTVQDITERKKTEEKIQYLANIVESSTDAIVTVSLDGIVTSWNKGAEQIFGYAAEDIMGKKVTILEPENLRGEIKQFVEMVKQGKKIKHYESSRLRKDGTIVIISGTLFPVLDMYGKPVAISVIARDITENKRAEEALRNFETARKREIHHRIKNNLQVISSLLDLQAEQFSNRECIKDSEVLRAFRESQDRVTSMALIHEELYRGRETDRLDFSSYIKELADNLFLTYKVGNKDIGLNIDLEEKAFFDIDTAIPLGIIVNELVSNSFKYAFQGRDKGEIRIRIRREESNNTSFILTISDNGVGIPEDLDIENLDSLGMQLVTTLVEQLNGKLELKRDNGTKFTIRFTVEENPSESIVNGTV